MKRLKLICGSLVAAAMGISSIYGAQFFVGAGGSDSFYLLSTNRCRITQVQVTGANAGNVRLYNNDKTNNPYWGTNWVTTGTFVTLSTYQSNAVSTFVGNNGVTNYTTNANLFTVYTTNAGATNAQSPVFAGIVAGSTYAVYNVDVLCERGLSALISSNLTVVVTYNSAQ